MFPLREPMLCPLFRALGRTSTISIKTCLLEVLAVLRPISLQAFPFRLVFPRRSRACGALKVSRARVLLPPHWPDARIHTRR